MNKEQFLENIKSTYAEGIKIIESKNKDYANSADPFLNFTLTERLNVTSVEKGILVRCCDKFARICNLMGKEEGPAVASETVEDTLLDLINYLAILKAYNSQKEGK